VPGNGRSPLFKQWALSVPFSLRYRFSINPQAMSRALTIVRGLISTFLINRVGVAGKSYQCCDP